MSEPVRKRPGRKPKPALQPRQIQGAKYPRPILDLLGPLHAHCPDPKRVLHFDAYCVWLLLYFFTPVLTSMRGLQQASGFEQVRRKLKLPRFSLGSFSEAAIVFDAALLEPIVEQIAGQLADIEPDERLRALGQRPVAVDGTLLHALPRMVWALWLDEKNCAAKLHLQYDLLRGAPERATLTDAQMGETRVFKGNLSPGRLYVTDRGYFDFDLMADILAAGSSFVTRTRENVVYEVIEENAISEASALSGVEQDAIVRAGCEKSRGKLDQPLRLVRIRVPCDTTPRAGKTPIDRKTKQYRERQSETTLTLLTDRLDLDVSHIGLLYRQRWQIELFFRWFKKVLQADHALSESENGMTIVIYCALIASMLVTLWTGKKPTKRTYEMICFYFAGWVSDQELVAHIKNLAPADDSSKKS